MIESATTSETPNTSFNTTHDDDDGVRLLAEMVRQAGREVLGGELPQSEQEHDRWREFATVLIEELKQAGARAGSVSSAPAFFTAHLRRRFRPAPSSPKAARPDPQLTRSHAAALSKEQRLLKMIRELTMLHVGDPGYSEQDLIDDLKFRCEREGIGWDEKIIKELLNKKEGKEDQSQVL